MLLKPKVLKLEEKWLLRTVALLISILLWITVVGGKKVDVTKSVVLTYKVRNGLILSGQSPKEISVRLNGPAVYLKEVEKQDLSYEIDLQDKNVGRHRINLFKTRLGLPNGINIISMSPRNIHVRVDQSIIKRVPVRPVLSSELPNGFKVKSVAIQPSTIEVRGAKSVLSLVESVPTDEISVSPSARVQEFSGQLNMDEFVGVKLVDEAASVRVTVDMEGPTSGKILKDIPIMLKDATGIALKKKELKRYKLVPESISLKVEGPKRVLDRLRSGDVEVWAVFPQNIDAQQRIRLTWKIPPEIRVVKRSSDWVATRKKAND